MTDNRLDDISPQLIKVEFPKYTEAVQCSRDLTITLKEFISLKPFKRECVVDGHLYDMINLEGTIPVVYKGEKYNIPLRVMLPEDYPCSPPIIYVQPTGGMRIATNMPYLNNRGKVTTDYLKEWNNKNHPDLYKVLHHLCLLFADSPPVWTKKTDSMVRVYEDRFKRNNQLGARARQPVQEQFQNKDTFAVPDSLHEPSAGQPQPVQPANQIKNNLTSHPEKGRVKKRSPAYASQHPSVGDNYNYNKEHGFVPYDPSEPLPTPGEFVPSPYMDQVNSSPEDEQDIKQPAAPGAKGSQEGSQVPGRGPFNILETYKCKKVIGSGGFAKVYLYENQVSKEKVACKVVDLGINDVSVQKCAAALKHEIKLLGSLNHSFIVSYISYEEYNNKLAIVMDYFPKGSLYQVMQTIPDEHFDEQRTRLYTWQILQGLIYLHENGVIHKDIKARNILVDEQDTIKIADFGISKKIENLVTLTTGTTDNLGSIYWQSPESLNPDCKCGRKTDIWSLGCTVVEMLLGKPPLNCDNIPHLQASVKILHGEVYPPQGCSDVTKEFLEMCFRNEKQRPTARALMAETDFPAYSHQD